MAFPSSAHGLLILVLLLPVTALCSPPSSLPRSEQHAAYLLLEAINPTTPWRSSYPDDLCLSGPHGLSCDLFPSIDGNLTAHITEFHLGYVSDSSPTPPCDSSAYLPPPLSSSFPFLRKLSFYRCFLFPSTVPDHFWRLPSYSPLLEELVFLENPSLSGNLPTHISTFTNLRKLIISGSNMMGTIPFELGKLGILEQLTLSRSRFHGRIPTSIGSLSNLKILDLSGNGLVGSVPATLGNLGELLKLDLGGNRLMGIVPRELSGLRKLEFMDVSANNLTGGMPMCIGEMGALKEVYLSGNEMLGGGILEVWGGLGGLVALGLSRTGVGGGIPKSMGVQLRRIAYLAMDGNRLDGEVPVEMRLVEGSAVEVNLEGNRLSGEVPFSAAFARRLGGKLRLAGNEGLCWPEKGDGGGGVGPCEAPGDPLLQPEEKVEVSSGCSLFHWTMGGGDLFPAVASWCWWWWSFQVSWSWCCLLRVL